MSISVAAAYMGMPEDAFSRHFGKFGVKDSRTVFWAKFQLDQIIMKQYDYIVTAPAGDVLAEQLLEWAGQRTRRPRDQIPDE
ncbi:hypothetical protein [Sphingobium yanoikuyae]|uniref:hypothetical protein n=1 Tax=Sphingobium yanoikuyae TaxID=13690 RepID=UPI0035AE6D65